MLQAGFRLFSPALVLEPFKTVFDPRCVWVVVGHVANGGCGTATLREVPRSASVPQVLLYLLHFFLAKLFLFGCFFLSGRSQATFSGKFSVLCWVVLCQLPKPRLVSLAQQNHLLSIVLGVSRNSRTHRCPWWMRSGEGCFDAVGREDLTDLGQVEPLFRNASFPEGGIFPFVPLQAPDVPGAHEGVGDRIVERVRKCLRELDTHSFIARKRNGCSDGHGFSFVNSRDIPRCRHLYNKN